MKKIIEVDNLENDKAYVMIGDKLYEAIFDNGEFVGHEAKAIPIIEKEDSKVEKELHFWASAKQCKDNNIKLNNKDSCMIFDISGCQFLSNYNIIHTTLPNLVTTELFTKGYRIFIHNLSNEIVEIKLGKNDYTLREIKMGNNLEKLLLANEFCQLY